MDCPRVRYPQLNDEIEAELAAGGYQVAAPGRNPTCKQAAAPRILVRAESCLWPLHRCPATADQLPHPPPLPTRGPLLAPPAQVLTGASEQVDKVVQLYEVMQTRHTTMLVGQSGGGKSVILNALAKAQGRLGLRTRWEPGRRERG